MDPIALGVSPRAASSLNQGYDLIRLEQLDPPHRRPNVVSPQAELEQRPVISRDPLHGPGRVPDQEHKDRQ